MRSRTRLALLLPALLVLTVVAAPGSKDAPPPTAPRPAFSLDRRVTWDDSKVVGSPDPPPPYRAVRAFPNLKITCPMGVAHQPGTPYLLLVHQLFAWGGGGRIARIKDDDGATEAEPFLTIDGIAYGVAFHPDHAKNGFLYVGSNGPEKGKPKTTRVIRYTLDRQPPYKVVPGSEKKIIEWESDGHNGGDLAFGPDGMLYVTSGDGTSDSDTNLTGQDTTKLLAKVLRIDVDREGEPGGVSPRRNYTVPKDNPFVGKKDFRPETWAYGFRNPWRIHVDRQTGDVWVGNNGQDLWEQIYLVRRGANYGWSVMEGSHPFYLNRKAGPTPFSRPITEHHHSEARSLSGGVVYRGKKLPDLNGAYVYGDWSTGKIWGVRHKDGKVTWHKELADTPLQVTGFGLDSSGELLIADHGGGYYRLEAAPKDDNPPKFPMRLSETGLFASVKEHRTHPGLIPYSVNAPLWSDGAHKDRFLALPGTSQIDFSERRGWAFSEGTVLVKTFSLDTEAGNPASRRRIETRLLTRQQGEWVGYSYEWNDEQTDAVLVEKAGKDRAYTIRDRAAPGGERRQTWHYPSRAECMVCHSRAANFVLGLSTVQMNRVYDYGSVKMNQLNALEKLGVFKVNASQHVQQIKAHFGPFVEWLRRSVGSDKLTAGAKKPFDAWEKALQANPRNVSLLLKPASAYPRLVDPSDAKEPVEARARSYLHANCAQCHVEAGGGNAAIDLEFTTAREKWNLMDVKPLHHTFDVPEARLIAPGQPDRSLLYLRVAKRGEGQMPQLATSEVDREAVQLLRDWIKGMK